MYLSVKINTMSDIDITRNYFIEDIIKTLKKYNLQMLDNQYLELANWSIEKEGNIVSLYEWTTFSHKKCIKRILELVWKDILMPDDAACIILIINGVKKYIQNDMIIYDDRIVRECCADYYEIFKNEFKTNYTNWILDDLDLCIQNAYSIYEKKIETLSSIS